MQMNLQNKLTILRIAMVPFFVVILLTNCLGEASKWVALAIFIIASLTDLADGKIARKYNLVTNFGKFMDPLADKILVCSGLICLTGMGILPAWMTIIIVARDFTISGFRLVASDKGVVIAANSWGKFKTASQMVMICLCIANLPGEPFRILMLAFEYIATALTIISLVIYIRDNIDVLRED